MPKEKNPLFGGGEPSAQELQLYAAQDMMPALYKKYPKWARENGYTTLIAPEKKKGLFSWMFGSDDDDRTEAQRAQDEAFADAIASAEMPDTGISGAVFEQREPDAGPPTLDSDEIELDLGITDWGATTTAAGAGAGGAQTSSGAGGASVFDRPEPKDQQGAAAGAQQAASGGVSEPSQPQASMTVDQVAKWFADHPGVSERIIDGNVYRREDFEFDSDAVTGPEPAPSPEPEEKWNPGPRQQASADESVKTPNGDNVYWSKYMARLTSDMNTSYVMVVAGQSVDINGEDKYIPTVLGVVEQTRDMSTHLVNPKRVFEDIVRRTSKRTKAGEFLPDLSIATARSVNFVKLAGVYNRFSLTGSKTSDELIANGKKAFSTRGLVAPMLKTLASCLAYGVLKRGKPMETIGKNGRNYTKEFMESGYDQVQAVWPRTKLIEGKALDWSERDKGLMSEFTTQKIKDEFEESNVTYVKGSFPRDLEGYIKAKGPFVGASNAVPFFPIDMSVDDLERFERETMPPTTDEAGNVVGGSMQGFRKFWDKLRVDQFSRSTFTMGKKKLAGGYAMRYAPSSVSDLNQKFGSPSLVYLNSGLINMVLVAYQIDKGSVPEEVVDHVRKPFMYAQKMLANSSIEQARKAPFWIGDADGLKIMYDSITPLAERVMPGKMALNMLAPGIYADIGSEPQARNPIVSPMDLDLSGWKGLTGKHIVTLSSDESKGDLMPYGFYGSWYNGGSHAATSASMQNTINNCLRTYGSKILPGQIQELITQENAGDAPTFATADSSTLLFQSILPSMFGDRCASDKMKAACKWILIPALDGRGRTVDYFLALSKSDKTPRSKGLASNAPTNLLLLPTGEDGLPGTKGSLSKSIHFGRVSLYGKNYPLFLSDLITLCALAKRISFETGNKSKYATTSFGIYKKGEPTPWEQTGTAFSELRRLIEGPRSLEERARRIDAYNAMVKGGVDASQESRAEAQARESRERAQAEAETPPRDVTEFTDEMNFTPDDGGEDLGEGIGGIDMNPRPRRRRIRKIRRR